MHLIRFNNFLFSKVIFDLIIHQPGNAWNKKQP